MSLLTATQHTAQYRITGDSEVELFRNAADLLEDLGAGEYLVSAGYDTESQSFTMGGKTVRTVHRRRMWLEIGR